MEFRGGFSLVHTSPSNIATHESPVSLNPLPSRRGPKGRLSLRQGSRMAQSQSQHRNGRRSVLNYGLLRSQPL
jgi:hypothetical protein